MSVLFFDIGATLADVTFEDDGSLTFRPRPRVVEVLTALAGVRKGVISNPGAGDTARERARAALDAAFAGQFTEAALLHWGPKTERGIFDGAVASAGVPADSCVFVGEDPDERTVARTAGLRTAAHPVFAQAAVEGRPVLWTRIGLPGGRGLAELDAVANAAEVVPVHVASDRLVLAMASERGASALRRAGFTTDPRGSVEETAAFLLRDDRPVPAPEAFAGEPPEVPAALESGLRASAAFAFAAGELAGAGPALLSLGPAPGGVYLAAAAAVP
ncbi:Zn-dependent exopeptidase M28, partial [Streptomyces goshikiensis]